jgi:coiled-coil domain-containing protein 40
MFFGHQIITLDQIKFTMSMSDNNQVDVVNVNAHGNDAGYESEEEEYYENPSEVIREFGNHPLMEKAQKALLAELKDTEYRLKTELYEKNEELKRATQDREGLGVQLYGLQQQLARIQITLENAHNEFNGIVDSRLQEEEMLRDISKNNTEQTALNEEYKKQHKKYAQELDALNETIGQIEKYNEEVKSEIAITRRATYKTEQSIQQLEKQKENQDFYVDNLNRQVNVLREQTAQVLKQLDSQSNDTSEANAVLKDTIRELELIGTEKKQLMVQWKAALSGLSRRDEALAQALQTLAAAESAVHDYDVEIEASRRDLQKKQASHESLVNLRDRLENELHWVEDNLNKIRIERDQMQERYTLLSKSLAQTDSEAKKLDTIAKQLNNEGESIVQNLQVVTQERQKLEEELLTLYSTHSNVNKAVDNLTKEQSKVLARIHERENEANEIENDIARTKVDRLNCTATNDQLQEQLAAIGKEVREKEALTGKYQLEIRQRNDEVEKKMYRVDRLNKKYEKMVESAGGEENLGPLENTIRNLAKETDAIMAECQEMERAWLKRQTEMVTISSECDQAGEQNNEQQARVTILTQQQLRLTKDLADLKNNLKVANQLNVDYQKDVSKLNALISSNHDNETELQAQNFILEMDCVEELRDTERDCVGLQASISETKTAKSTLMDEIMEMERQSLLWEKKIQLDKETRQALDPSVGQGETENMEKEIHRMALRFEALKREQERLSVEMERAITKRSTITTRYSKPKAVNNASGGAGQAAGSRTQAPPKELTQATAKTRIGALKKEARMLAEETSHYGSLFQDKKLQMEQISVELEDVTSAYGDSEELCHQLQSQINDLLYQKQLQQERISYKQKYALRLRELSQSGVDSSQSLQVERRVLSATQALDNVKEIIFELQSTFPHLREVLERVSAMTDPSINIGMTLMQHLQGTGEAALE